MWTPSRSGGGKFNEGLDLGSEVKQSLLLPNLVRRTADAAEDYNDLYEGQRSSEVKLSKLCSMATKLGQKNRRCKFNVLNSRVRK